MIEFVDPPKPSKVRGVTAETKAILVTAGKTKGRCDVYARWVGES